MRRTTSTALPAEFPSGITVGKLLHDLASAPTAQIGRWATIEVWEPDPAFDPVSNADRADVFPVASTAASSFTITGDQTDRLHDFFPIYVDGSTPNGAGVDNDGYYLLNGEPTLVSGNTVITIHGVLPDVAITDGDVILIPPARLKSTGRKDRFVNRSISLTGSEGTFAVAQSTHYEQLLIALGCGPEE